MTLIPRDPGTRGRQHTIGRGRALMGVAALVVLLAPAGAMARNDGLIAFRSDRGGQGDIWVMAPDGTNARNLTNDKVEDDFPVWSQNGKQIAWARGGRGPQAEIWVMNADGSGKRQVTSNTFDDYNPTWSPDGSEIAYRSFRGNNRDIYAIRVDGTGERRLTDDPASDYAPDWSPDGARIAFTSSRSGANAIYSMQADGSDVQQLTPDYLNAALPGWSPSGDRIAFSDGFCDLCSESDQFVMNADGTGITQVTDSAENELGKSWSRDGASIVMDFSTLTPSEKHLSKGDIAVTDVVSGATVNLTNTTGISEEHPDWSPGGRPATTNAAGTRATASRSTGPEHRDVPRVWSARAGGGSTVFFTLPRAGEVRLRIFDVGGREVECVANGWRATGSHSVMIANGRTGSQVLYYQLDFAGRRSSGKLVLVK